MMWTLLRASVEGSLVVAAVWTLSRLLSLSPATRTILWWCAAAKFVLALAWTTPIALPVLPPPQAAAAGAVELAHGEPVRARDIPTLVSSRVAGRVGSRVAARVSDRVVPASGGTFMATVAASIRGIAEWASFAVLAWVAGLMLIAFVAARRWSETSRIVRDAVPAAGHVQQQAAALAERLALRRVPEVRMSGAIETPLVTGFRQPVVLLPADRFSGLSERQQEMALCHELAHLKRADLWLGCVPAAAERLFFFHPLAHFVSREYSLAREAACDAAVVETLDAAPREYGCLLLALGVSRPQAGAAANAAWSFLHLKRRIAMLQELSSSPRRSRAVAAGAVALALLAIVPLRLVARPAAPQQSRQHDAAPGRAVEAPVARAPEAPVMAVEQERRGSDKDLSFVLLSDGDETVSGSSEDLERARGQQRDGEPLLWVRRDGREYVIRDRDVIRMARDAWKHFNDRPLHELVSADHLAQMELHIPPQAIAEIGRLGADIGASALEAVQDVLRDIDVGEILRDAHIGEAVRELHLEQDTLRSKQLEDVERSTREIRQNREREMRDRSRQTREIARQARELGDSMREMTEDIRREVERSLRQELDAHRDQLRELKYRIRDIEEPLRELRKPMRDLAEPMAELGRQMGEIGRDIGDAARRAMDDMREIIERAIESGKAKPVK